MKSSNFAASFRPLVGLALISLERQKCLYASPRIEFYGLVRGQEHACGHRRFLSNAQVPETFRALRACIELMSDKAESKDQRQSQEAVTRTV
jgi:hypothetical protein